VSEISFRPSNLRSPGYPDNASAEPGVIEELLIGCVLCSYLELQVAMKLSQNLGAESVTLPRFFQERLNLSQYVLEVTSVRKSKTKVKNPIANQILLSA
jgi:hypothetical protein